MSAAVHGNGDHLDRDNCIVPFSTVQSRALGRLVRLGSVVDDILSRHNYPTPVSIVLGQAIALTAMLGTTLKFDGDLVLQTKTDGPLGFLVVNFSTPGELRAHASFDADAVAKLGDSMVVNAGELIGKGYLAITIDPGGGMDRYQGIVGMEGHGLSTAAHTYFRQSEQLPTFTKLSVARFQDREDGSKRERWRAGGLLLQHVSPVGGKEHKDDEDDFLLGEEDDNWRRVEMLAQTVEDHEMVDPTLAPERLLYRLFHEEGVRAAQERELNVFCRCSQERVQNMLQSFRREDLEDLRDENGDVVVTCEFCNRSYSFPMT